MTAKYSFTALVFLISCTCIARAADVPLPLSLRQCIDLALKNNIDVLVSKTQEKQAEGQQEIWDSDLLPQIDAVSSQQRTWWENIGALGFPGFTGVIGPFNTFNAQIMVSQRILDFSALAHAQAGKIKTESAQLQIALASQQVILSTGLAYIQALGYAEELASSYEDVRLAEKFLTLSLHQLDAGLASQVDVARERTQLAQQKARQEQLRLNVIKSQLELKRLIRIPLAQPIALTDALQNQNPGHLDVDEAIAAAKKDRMEIQVDQADSRYAVTELKASRRQVLPTVGVTGAWGETGLTPSRDVTHAADAMVSVSLPIWEGGRIAGDIKGKQALNEEQRVRSEDLNWKIEEDVRVALEILLSSRTQVDAVRQVKDFAQRELVLAQDRFSSGLGDNIQLINAQDALADAGDKYAQALAQYDQAQLNYFGALGHPQQFDLSVNNKEGKE